MYEKRDPFRGPVWERRPWCDSRRFQWRGEFRPRPADGYAPDVRDYDTGLPTKGVKTEYGRVRSRRADGVEPQHCRAENRTRLQKGAM